MNNIPRDLSAQPDALPDTPSESEEQELFELLLAQEGIDPELFGDADAPTDSAPLSFAQEQLWLLDRLQPGDASYVIPIGLRLRGPLDLAALERCLGRLLQRHEALRTAFTETAGGVQQQVAAAPSVLSPSLIDLRDLPEAERDTVAAEFLHDEARRPFDLAAGRLLRATLLVLGETEHLLLLCVHHIVFDAWSLGVLMRELIALYRADASGREIGPLPLQYRDFARGQRRRLRGPRLEELRGFWRRTLEGSPELLSLPTDRPRPGALSSRGARMPVRVPQDVTAALRTLSRAAGCSLFTTVLSGFAVLLGRYSDQRDVVIGTPVANRSRTELEGLIGFFVNVVPLRLQLDGCASFQALVARCQQAVAAAFAHQDLPFALIVEALGSRRSLSHNPLFQASFALLRKPEIPELLDEASALRIQPLEMHNGTAKFDLTLDLWETSDELDGYFEYSTDLFDHETMAAMARHLGTLLAAAAQHAGTSPWQLPLLDAAERHQLLVERNAAPPLPPPVCIHHQFLTSAQQHAEATALTCEGESLTYRALAARAVQLAARLRATGVGPEVRVGVYLERSPALVEAILGVLLAGGAYVPLDPTYPHKRIRFMLEDAGVHSVVTTHALAARLGASGAPLLLLDAPADAAADAPRAAADRPEQLAYILYTSGSTGTPQGVMVEHRNVASFFAAMDRCLGVPGLGVPGLGVPGLGVPGLGVPADGVWLAVTSASFDISVLELLWTLCRGFHVVLQRELLPTGDAAVARAQHSAARALDMSLLYFACDEDAEPTDRYRLLREGARFADENGLTAVWTPERHFHPFGGLYPNPAVTGAALAAITQRVQIRAGSVVLPLHDPIRVAEEWSVVDNLSHGRVGIAIASGWHAEDFVLNPEGYGERKRLMLERLDTLRRLWAGESVRRRDGLGREVEVRVFPRPVQRELPLWLTAAGHPDTFRIAGEQGISVLTHLLGQSLEELAERIAIYRRAYRDGGHPGRGRVSLMLHTFVGEDLDVVREQVRRPFYNYLRQSADLMARLAHGLGHDPGQQLNEADIEAMLGHAFERYFARSGLMGTQASCLRMLALLREAGVDEVACLIDFGLPVDAVLRSLGRLRDLRAAAQAAAHTGYGIAEQITRHRVTHLQCTPSLARLLAADAETLTALGTLRQLLLGGEPLPLPLARELSAVLPGGLRNMYGPTETTVWSTSARVPEGVAAVSIGRPIAGTSVYVLDEHLQPVPIGVAGELYIGGPGVVRGYHRRPEATTKRFVADPFTAGPEARLYRTGDRVRYRRDGELEFLGRRDDQIKLRGFRIELSEIEGALARDPEVEHAAVALHKDAQGEPQLCAYVVPREPTAAPAGSELLREHVAQWQAVWDSIYQTPAAADEDPAFRIAGWRSSFTDEPIPAAEMREWIERTVERITALRPRRVLEIGCGTGLLLFQLAPRCQRYLAQDFAPAALAHVAAEAARRGLSQVELFAGAADHLEGVPPASVDVVVLNSVVQYFQSLEYLLSVLGQAVDKVADGGAVFVGDVRSLPHLAAMQAAVLVHRAAATAPRPELAAALGRRIAEEEELLCAPELFAALPAHLPRIRAVQVLRKRGRADNEMNRFRYDVVLHVGTAPAAAAPPVVWPGSGLSLPALRERLLAERPAALLLSAVPDRRLAGAVWLAEAVASTSTHAQAAALREAQAEQERTAVDLEELCALGESLGYSVQPAPARSGELAATDVLLQTAGADGLLTWARPAPSPLSTYANAPLRNKMLRSVVPRLQKRLRETLPEYMVPTAFTLLSALPLTPNGKLDRRALPPPAQVRAAAHSRAHVPPRTPSEEKLAALWSELLGVADIGVEDNFFELGGHSFSAAQLLFRLRKAFSRELPLATLIQNPTIAQLARLVDEGST